jgi:hypothetical protein
MYIVLQHLHGTKLNSNVTSCLASVAHKKICSAQPSNQTLSFQRRNIHWEEKLTLLLLPTSNKRLARPPSKFHNLLVFRDCPLYPTFPFIRHHDHFIAMASVIVLSPRRVTVRKVDPELRMFRGYVLQPLRRIPELERLEDVVLVHPVMCLLVEGAAGKRVADIEDIAIYLLVSVCCEVLRPLVGGCCGT